MTIINVHEAKTNLSKLLEQVEQGEEIIIARAGKPIAKLTRYRHPKRTIAAPGGMAGEIWIADDFDAPLDDQFETLRTGSPDNR
ncbi:MAG: type II toxin-antitoxin system Phd/YefM family antitoxin [Betaproteobacteria bacterium]|nr:type II toxin-antitoxin system Phd/YefM family antitoxin [Betaproteobacteria bacterium]